MDKKSPKSYAGIVIVLGAVWGLSEAALGMWLKNCASSVSGSVMTGYALLFIAASWIFSRRVLGVVLLVVVASLFKLFDAFLLSLPIQHGAVANPIFAFILEGTVFLFLVALFKQTLLKKRAGQGLLGGTAALGAVGLFPLVKFVTGIPACVVPGSNIPLSLYYAPLAICLSFLTVPLGFWLGQRLESVLSIGSRIPRFNTVVSPLALIFCLAIVTLIRLI
ncbi:MAG: hypothetical protein PVF22_03675 [Candidatus Aminicenantes bacterium]